MAIDVIHLNKFLRFIYMPDKDLVSRFREDIRGLDNRIYVIQTAEDYLMGYLLPFPIKFYVSRVPYSICSNS